MAISEELAAFVKEGLDRGISRTELEGVLIEAGWPADAFPAAAVAAVAYAVLGGGAGTVEAAGAREELSHAGSLWPLVMIVPPALTIGMLLRRAHLVPSLMAGIVAAASLGLLAGLIAPGDLLHIDRAALERLLERAERTVDTARRTEWSIFATISAAVLLTTHSVVAILAVGRLARDTGPEMKISRYRRANILDITVCTYPFLLPFFIPTILASSLTNSGAALGVPPVSAYEAGLANLHSWGLLLALLAALATGRGRLEGR